MRILELEAKALAQKAQTLKNRDFNRLAFIKKFQNIIIFMGLLNEVLVFK